MPTFVVSRNWLFAAIVIFTYFIRNAQGSNIRGNSVHFASAQTNGAIKRSTSDNSHNATIPKSNLELLGFSWELNAQSAISLPIHEFRFLGIAICEGTEADLKLLEIEMFFLVFMMATVFVAFAALQSVLQSLRDTKAELKALNERYQKLRETKASVKMTLGPHAGKSIPVSDCLKEYNELCCSYVNLKVMADTLQEEKNRLEEEKRVLEPKLAKRSSSAKAPRSTSSRHVSSQAKPIATSSPPVEIFTANTVSDSARTRADTNADDDCSNCDTDYDDDENSCESEWAEYDKLRQQCIADGDSGDRSNGPKFLTFYIGNLSFQATSYHLKKAFKDRLNIEVDSAIVARSSDGLSRGCAFVTLKWNDFFQFDENYKSYAEDENWASHLCTIMNNKSILGRNIYVELAKSQRREPV